MHALLQVFMAVPGAEPTAVMTQPADFSPHELATMSRALAHYLELNPGIQSARSSEFKINLAISAMNRWVVERR